MTGRRPQVSNLGVVTALPTKSFCYAHAVLPDGKLALLRTQIDFRTIYKEWRESNATDRIPYPAILAEALAQLSVFDGERETDAFEIPAGGGRLISRWPDGRWIVAHGRANNDDLNGTILAPDGTVLGTIHAGDGIQHMLCAPDETLWLGYFDEGVYGNVSFQGREPLGVSGIANLSDAGNLLFDANSSGYLVDDCYAMTLDGDALWACTYSGFPIVQIARGAIRRWANPITGPQALAVDGDLVLLFGGYNDDATRLALVQLQQDSAVLVGEVDLAGFTPEVLLRAQGCGDTLHLTRADVWHRIRVRDFAAYLEEQSQ